MARACPASFTSSDPERTNPNDHLHLRSPDPEAAATFYLNMLGAGITNRVPTPRGRRIVMALGGVTMFIEEVPVGTHAAPLGPYAGVEHVGVTGLHAAVAEMKTKGAHFTLEPT